jgi:uncharacterized cofD-like protein
MNIVGIGGGTGLPVLLGGLKELNDSGEETLGITAVVTVSDNGGSTGVLRDAFDMPAMGDVRNSIISLASCKSALASVFQHRFYGANGFAGHSLGNLVFAALYEMNGSFSAAVGQACALLEAAGIVLPATDTPVHLWAIHKDGTISEGESNIPKSASMIERVGITPPDPQPAPGVLKALLEADAIVLGPGSLYTSVVPNLLVDGVAEAIAASRALKIYVCNLMTQPGETLEYSASDHLRTLQSYLPARAVDVCVVNTTTIGTGLAERYSGTGSRFVLFDSEADREIRRAGVVPASAPLIKSGEVKVRHDPLTLARLVVSLGRGVVRSHGMSAERTEREVTCAESLDISVPEKSQVYL